MKLTELRKKRKELQEEIVETAKQWLAEESAVLFKQFPKMESFSWNQYSPHWNDGEECNFSANTDSPDINGVDEYSNEEKELTGAYEKVTKLLRKLEDAELEEMFGNHVEVTVTSKGVEISDYDHD